MVSSAKATSELETLSRYPLFYMNKQSHGKTMDLFYRVASFVRCEELDRGHSDGVSYFRDRPHLLRKKIRRLLMPAEALTEHEGGFMGDMMLPSTEADT